MFIKLTLSDQSLLYVNREPDGSVRFENYTGIPDNSKCVWGHGLTAEQATELKNYLTSQGF